MRDVILGCVRSVGNEMIENMVTRLAPFEAPLLSFVSQHEHTLEFAWQSDVCLF